MSEAANMPNEAAPAAANESPALASVVVAAEEVSSVTDKLSSLVTEDENKANEPTVFTSAQRAAAALAANQSKLMIPERVQYWLNVEQHPGGKMAVLTDVYNMIQTTQSIVFCNQKSMADQIKMLMQVHTGNCGHFLSFLRIFRQPLNFHTHTHTHTHFSLLHSSERRAHRHGAPRWPQRPRTRASAT